MLSSNNSTAKKKSESCEGKLRRICKNIAQELDIGLDSIVFVDDSDFVTRSFSNWLWVTFTRSNPANDIYGLNAIIQNKHFWQAYVVIITFKHH